MDYSRPEKAHQSEFTNYQHQSSDPNALQAEQTEIEEAAHMHY